MAPKFPRLAPSLKTILCVIVAAGTVAFTTQAQQLPSAEGSFAAGKTPAPLELPPLPPKKLKTNKFGDWTQRCDTRPGVNAPQCFLTQTIVQNKDGKKRMILAITVGLLGQDQQPGMILLLPLDIGLFLPPGLIFNVPGTEPVRIAVQSCLRDGCRATTQLTPDIITAMQKGSDGTLEIRTIRKQIVRVPVSFKGFTAAFASLRKDQG